MLIGDINLLCYLFPPTEYLALSQQLDSLNTALDVLESRSDNLQEEARKLIMDTRAAREQNSSGAPEQINGEEKDSSQCTEAAEAEGDSSEVIEDGRNSEAEKVKDGDVVAPENND